MKGRKFQIGGRIMAKDPESVCEYLRQDLCLLGYNDTAFCVTAWEKRGHYCFEFFTGNTEDIFELITNN